MSDDTIFLYLKEIADLLYSLPERMCDEMEKRDAIQKAKKLKELQDEIDFHHANLAEINKFMYGFGPIKVVPDDPKDEKAAEQLGKMYNHFHTKVRT